ELARNALAAAQEHQIQAHNQGCHSVEDIQVRDQVLVNPYSLQLVEAQGTGHKLVQCAIGPFKVMEQINNNIYRLQLLAEYPMHPVIN
ncbi:hypothetical protein ARMSODRAFT_854857, partial [Armillaria solidipes]